MAARIQITLTADSLSETTTPEFQDEFRRFTALHEAAPDLLAVAKFLTNFLPASAPEAPYVESVIARAEGRS